MAHCENSIRKLKISRNIKTVDDLITRSDVNDILSEAAQNKADITDIIIISKTSDGLMHYSWAVDDDGKNETLKALGMIEYTKNMILNPPEDEDD